MQPDDVGFFDGDSGQIEASLRQCLIERNGTEDKLQRQILTLRIRELRDKLLSSKPVRCDEGAAPYPGDDHVGLFDGDIGRIEFQLRDAVRRRSSCLVESHRGAIQKEVSALVELLKSPVIHANAGLAVDTRRLWSHIRSQNIAALHDVDPILLRTLRDPTTGHSALHRAVFLNNTELVDVLVKEKGCDIDSICLTGQTPLHMAVQVENFEVAKKLVDLGANQESVDYKGRTPLSGVPHFILSQILNSGTSDTSRDDSWELDPAEIHYGTIIGEGATATVYEGTYGEKKIALKNFSSIQRTEFNREVRILMKLDHPNLVAFVGATNADKLRLVMELCEGGSLFSLLHDRGFELSCNQILEICRGTLSGLHYLHTQSPQIIHMDLKSRNLLISKPIGDDSSPVEIKIADFGVSRISSSTCHPCLTTVGGTSFWMSPETLVGDFDEISDKSDMYSFAICLFEMLSGELPFASVEGLNMLPPVTVAIKVANGFRPDITRIRRNDSATAEMIQLMEKCWSYEPSDRLSPSELLSLLPPSP